MRAAEELLGAVRVGDRHADAGGDDDPGLLAGPDLERGAIASSTAEPAEGVGVADDAVEPGGDRAQQFVAGAVAERVVDVLEVVEVDEERRRRPVSTRTSAAG